VRSGKPYAEIIRLASELQADIVIRRVRGHDSLDSALFSSAAYQVIQIAPCPVLAVHI
jgi:nucleotide-binding universal stress UspA family protein